MPNALLLTTLVLTLGQADNGLVLRNRPPITEAIFHPDGRRVYCVTSAGLEAYDAVAGKVIFDAPYPGRFVCSPKGDKVALVSTMIGMIRMDGVVVVLDGQTGKKIHHEKGTSAAFSPDGRWLISHSMYSIGHPAADLPPKVQITDLRSGKTHIAQLRTFDSKPLSLRFGDHRGATNFHFTNDGNTSGTENTSCCARTTRLPGNASGI